MGASAGLGYAIAEQLVKEGARVAICSRDEARIREAAQRMGAELGVTADPRFLLEKAVEKELLKAFPGEFLSRYTLVSFSRVPYRLSYEVGRIAGGIVSELSEGLARAEDVDLKRARALIDERLVPFVKEHSDGFGTAR